MKIHKCKTSILSIYLRDPQCKMVYIERLFTAVLFAIANDYKESACPPADKSPAIQRKIIQMFQKYFLYFNMEKTAKP